MDETNYSGALIFWIYILAAFFFSYMVIQSIISIRPGKDERQKTKGSDSGFIWLFGALAGLSFTTLSYNMLTVLAHSYQAWSLSHGMAANISPAQIWHWSTTSTLFRDFAEAIVFDSIRYFWAQSALLATLWLCMYMGTEGKRYDRTSAFSLTYKLSRLPSSNTTSMGVLRPQPDSPDQLRPKPFLRGTLAPTFWPEERSDPTELSPGRCRYLLWLSASGSAGSTDGTWRLVDNYHHGGTPVFAVATLHCGSV